MIEKKSFKELEFDRLDYIMGTSEEGCCINQKRKDKFDNKVWVSEQDLIKLLNSIKNLSPQQQINYIRNELEGEKELESVKEND